MSNTFRALQAQAGEDHQVEYVDVGEDALGDGNVTVAVEYSTVNYKDGLAITNASPIVRKKPLILGIDYAGTVLESTSDRFSVGDKVVRNGFGASEMLNGGYCQRARASDQHLVGLPDGISTRQAMAIGTAGYTSMLCVLALEDGGVAPSQGEVLVTGAAGGVGTVAVAILSKLGYTVVASTGRPQEADFLKDLGASSIIDRQELSEKGGPIQKERWAGVVDCVGSHTLANALATTKYGGVVAACGLAQGVDLPATVLPFILRGVQLQGIDSVQAPLAKRERAWARLATDLDLNKLEKLSFDVAFSDVKQVALDVLAGRTRGRAIVEIAS
jgi:acrylyl-CoA reductase (NADPH)